MHSNSPRKLEDARRLSERAAEWLVVLRSGSAVERAEFAEWIAASPRHAEEFLYATALEERLRQTDLRALAAVQRVLQGLPENVVTLEPRDPRLGTSASSICPDQAEISHGAVNATPSQIAATRRLNMRSSKLIGIAASVLLVLTATLWLSFSQAPTYATAIGEQRTVRLDDGSTMELNTQSRVQVRFSEHIREIRLLQGEALFAVKRDPARPFRVTTDAVVVQALGTQFNVYQHRRGTTVAVVEGRVSVAPLKDDHADIPSPGEDAAVEPQPPLHPGEAPYAQLAAGEKAEIEDNGRIVKQTGAGSAARAVAWREHRLVFLSTTLTDVAAEFNRYNRSPRLIVKDERAGERRYSGVFNANDPQAFIDFLREDAELELEQHGRALTIRAAQRMPDSGGL